MTKTPVIRSLALAATLAACSFGARAELPGESWWRMGGGAAPAATMGVVVEGPSFCAVAATGPAQGSVWILRGRVIDGRLVERSRTVLRGAAEADDDEDAVDPTDFFVQPTAMVQRERSLQHPRGDFTLFEPLRAAPGNALWLDLAWHCSAEEAVDRLAEARVPR